MEYNFDQIIERTGTNCVKWEGMQHVNSAAGADTLPFWVADMDFACAQPIVEALHKRVDNLIYGYGFTDEGYTQAVTGWYKRRFGMETDPKDLFYCPGIVPALGYLIHILTEPDEGVLIQKPVYHPFASQILQQGRRIINNPLVQNDGYYTMDYEDLEQKAKDPKTTLMILCSPHNPVGRVWKAEELSRVVRICMENGVKIISDEIHCDLLRQGVEHIPTEMAAPQYRNGLITLTAPSKTFNLAGLQTSNVIIHDPQIKKKWKQYVVKALHIDGPNVLSMAAVKAAYNECEPWLEQLKAYLDGNVRFMESFFKLHLPKARFTPPEGTYLAWVDLRAYGMTSQELDACIIKKANILLNGGTIFGEEGEGFQRVNFACPRKQLEEGLTRLANALQDHNMVE